MHARRGTRLAGLLVAATLLPAQAVMAGLPNDILTGLNLLDYRFQLQKNYLGKGWDFDTAAFYSGQTFRFGLADLTLGATSPSSVAISTGFTTRGLPAARFSMTTSQPLSYTLNANYGFQDLTATGNILIDIDTTINALGFYDLTFQLSNRGTFQTEGFAGADQGTLDFDAGPIVVSGNLYADVLAVLTQPFFTASGTENPFAKFSQKAVRGLPEGMDLNSITDLTAVGSDDIGRAVNNAIIASLLGQEPSKDLFTKLILPDALQLTDLVQAETEGASLQQVPEPATVALIALGSLAMCWPRRRKAA